jgi:hypothetical protein
MSCQPFRTILLAVVAGLTLAAGASSAKADQWTAPTPEELSMTSQAGAPGASAVYLFREEKTEDHLHMYSVYERIKILTEGGKERANVELKYQAGGSMGFQYTDIAGRTIHPDGTIITFTGKPYERVVVKTQGYREKAKVFTLPDVTVGSIIEYRYKLRWEDNMYQAPRWIVQNDLYLRKGHFQWLPTDRQLITSDERGQLTSTVSWTPILPAGAQVKETALPGARFGGEGSTSIELNVQDIPPSPEEEYMPPIQSLGYRVLFYFSPYRTMEEYWKGEGKHWSKLEDKFIGPGPVVGAAVQQLVSQSDTQDQKLKKIYAAVEQLENTDYTREHSRVEDKAAGLTQVRTTDDIWTHKRGSSDQIAELFVAMARAAGMKAYVMAVTNRDRSIFIQNFLSLRQLDDYIAIVNIDGKDKSFDPGSRFCAYGHLAWKHSDTGGLRQTDGGTMLAGTPGETYLDSAVYRVANLKMDETGVVNGKIDLKFMGSPALKWRQKALVDDKETVERELKDSVERMLPGGMDLKVLSINHLEDYEEPLTATLEVKGPIGSPTGKRLLIPGDIFESNSKATFAHDKRELPVCFQYRYAARDAIRINFPAGFQVESVPSEGSVKLPKMAVYNLKATADDKGVTIRRDLYLAEITYMTKEYPDLKTFYTQFEAKDQEPIILKVAATAPSGN